MAEATGVWGNKGPNEGWLFGCNERSASTLRLDEDSILAHQQQRLRARVCCARQRIVGRSCVARYDESALVGKHNELRAIPSAQLGKDSRNV